MGYKYSPEKVRSALIEIDVLSESKSNSISDEQLKKYHFFNDLGMNSLDFMLFIQHLEVSSCLHIPDMALWDCHTVQDVLALEST